MSRIDEETALLRTRFTNLEVDPQRRWFVVPDVKLAKGWNLGSTPILVELPPGYPSTPPDNFYTSPDLQPPSGGPPANTSGLRIFAGTPWLQFSIHIETGDWQAHADIKKSHTLLTYLEGVLRRLQEVE